MDNQIRVQIFRNLDNRKEGLPDDSPRAIELHRLRASAIHNAFDSAPGISVSSWGDTDTPEAHELVELLVLLAQPPVLHAVSVAAISAAKYLGAAAVGETVKEGVKWIFDRLREKQEKDEIESVNLQITPAVNIQMDPPKYGGRVSISVQVDGPPQGAAATA